jgi:uncharacterized protein (TIGR02246 family)
MQPHSKTFVLVCCAIASLGNAVANGAEPGTSAPAEVAAIRAAADEYLAAVRGGNAEEMRKAWTPEGDYVDASGQHFKAHELIRQQRATAPAGIDSNPASAEVAKPDSSVRFITPTVAIEDGSADFGVSNDGSALTGHFTAVWVKRDGRWLLDSLREAVSQSPSVNDQLQQLSWLLGEWAGTSEDQAIVISAHWSDGGSYIVREFAVHGSGDKLASGTERIGWDPKAGQVVSWTFDSQGGRSESRWSRDGERWLVESSKTMPDGNSATTTSIYTPGEAGRFSWEVRRASVANEQLPPVRIEFKRAAEDE